MKKILPYVAAGAALFFLWRWRLTSLRSSRMGMGGIGLPTWMLGPTVDLNQAEMDRMVAERRKRWAAINRDRDAQMERWAKAWARRNSQTDPLNLQGRL